MMVLDHPVAPTTILVVEDEMLLRMRAVDMVEDAGCISVEAVDAEAAFAILESRPRHRVAVHRHSNAGQDGRTAARTCGA